MTDDLDAIAAELERLDVATTPGPWLIWREPTADREDAARELRELVDSTTEFVGSVYMLEAGGHCPATTGCGPTSKQNAALITLMRTYLPTLLAERKRLKAEIERLDSIVHSWSEP